jgi:hypothetical protein
MPSVYETFDIHPDALLSGIASSSDGADIAKALLPMAMRSYRSQLTGKFIQEYGCRVQNGVFAGMLLPQEASWGGDGDLLPKLLGAYEAELHPALNDAFTNDYSIIVNIGCAEGYYAVGAATRQSSARVYAFDISEAARRICAAAAVMNSVADRIRILGRCSTEQLCALLDSKENTLLIVDCEGAELELLKPDEVPALAAADLLVECHDFKDRTITRSLRERFSPTHRIQVIKEGTRSPLAHPFLEGLSGVERAIATCEFRPELMTWMFCTSLRTHES